MPKFLFTYRMPEEYTAGGDDALAAWADWFADLGPAVVERGNPTFTSAGVGKWEAGTKLGGYSLISAPDLDAAVALAGGSPALRAGGGVVVGEITNIMDGH